MTVESNPISSPIVGSWRLVSFALQDEEGTVTRPWGEEVNGLLILASDGAMSEQFGSAHRPMLAHDDWVSASAWEIDLAARHYFAYSGAYSVEGDVVVYHIDVSLMPNWVGKTERRFWSVAGDTLTIATPELLVGGKQQIATLVWKRADGG